MINIFWLDVDMAVPAYRNQVVKVKVADFCGDFKTFATYDKRSNLWYDEDGICLNDNVYKWKPIKR